VVTTHDGVGAQVRRPDPRFLKTVQKIEMAKSEALRLVEENEGIYPYNSGRLDQAEICRLAGVRPALLGQNRHKEETRPNLNTWLENVNKDLVRGMYRIRKVVTGRVSDWKAAYEDLLTSFHIVELELETAERLVKALQQQVRDLGAVPVEF
jgi:hypothetical protein